MEYNYNQFALMFDVNCLSSDHLNTLLQNNFTLYDRFVRGFVPVMYVSTFILDFDDTMFIQDCLLEWNYEYVIPTEIICEIENTNLIQYDHINKPIAWALDVIDNVTDGQYKYPKPEQDIDLWILDTGIFWKHKEFEHIQVIDLDSNWTIANLTSPHGTGTASAAIGQFYGTSKSNLVYNFPVCKYGGSCGSADIEKGFLAILNHVKKRKSESTQQIKRTVINLSVGANYNQPPINSALGQYYNTLFKEIDENGGIIVVAAGNSNQDACNWFYSYSPFVISVGSLDDKYNKSGFSNYGSCVDVWMFGSNVPLAYSISDPNVIQYKSGTSFASPLVAGIIMNLLQEYPTLNKEQILNYLYRKRNNFTVPYYNCGLNKKQCCQGDLRGTRFDAWCRSHSIYTCDRTCKVFNC